MKNNTFSLLFLSPDQLIRSGEDVAQKRDYPRTYREQMLDSDLVSYGIVQGKSDLFIKTSRPLVSKAYHLLRSYRKEIESYGISHPSFLKTHRPYPEDDDTPDIVFAMIRASRLANVGPMASVAGAIAEFVGRDLTHYSEDVIIENGGDDFISSTRPRLAGTFSGTSRFSQTVYISVPPVQSLGICTSSGTIGHSFSYGRADAATVLAPSATLADAAATAVCNAVRTKDDIERGLAVARSIPGISAAIIIAEDDIGVWGALKLGKSEEDNALVFELKM
jgi:hypothetical protein